MLRLAHQAVLVGQLLVVAEGNIGVSSGLVRRRVVHSRHVLLSIVDQFATVRQEHHSCLLAIAWIFFAAVASLLVRLRLALI